MHSHQNHNHHSDGSNKRIALAFFLNLGFTVIEFIGGLLTNSAAIMADAVHDLGDCISIGSAWILGSLSKRKGDKTFSYGYRRLSLLGALFNGLVLVCGSIWVLSEALPRLVEPVMPDAQGMLLLAILGVAVNGYAAFRLSEGKTLNERVLNWHLIEDALGWVAVFVVALILQFVSWPILDPLLSICFTLFVLFNVAKVLWETGRIFLQAVPDPSLMNKIKSNLTSLDGVEGLHHVHLWSLDGEKHVFTAHVVLGKSFDIEDYNDMKRRMESVLAPFELLHSTIEIELRGEHCRDASTNDDVSSTLIAPH